MSKPFFVSCLCVVAVLGVGAGCGDSEPPESESFKMKIDAEGLDISARSSDGEKIQARIGGDQQLPADFPQDIPIFPKAKPTSSMSQGEIGTIVTFQTGAQPAEVQAFYRKEFADRGWEIESQLDFGAQQMLGASKGDIGVSVVVTAGNEGDTNIVLTVAKTQH